MSGLIAESDLSQKTFGWNRREGKRNNQIMQVVGNVGSEVMQ